MAGRILIYLHVYNLLRKTIEDNLTIV